MKPHVVVWPIVLFLVFPLKDSRPGGARPIYDHARRLFERGYLALSQQEAASGFALYRASDPAWASEFQLLEAESMLFRGMYGDALGILSTYRCDKPSDGMVKRLSIEAVALSRQQQMSAADLRLTQADSICRAADFPACSEALAARAIVTARKGNLSDAREILLRSLSLARNQRNQWLQVTTKVNLGYFALLADHNDEAVDWSRSAFEAAGRLGYENLAQVAAGNLGWAYFQLGDDDRALGQFLTAEKAAARLGNIRTELKWLYDAGHVYRDSGDWARAELSYRQALDLARQINSKEDLINALENLAFAFTVTGKPDQAAGYIDQVTPMETANGAHPSANLALSTGMLAASRRQFTQAETCFRFVQSDPTALMSTKLAAGFELARLFELQSKTAAAERMYKATLAQYESARARLKSEESQLPFGANAADIYGYYIRLLVQQGKDAQALAVADQSRAQTLEQSIEEPSAKKSVRSGALNPRQIAQRTKSTLLFYWLGENQSYLWAITPAKTALYTLPPQREIADRIARYNKFLLDLRDPLDSANADGQALYRELVAPAASMLRPNTSVIVLADGALNQLNFETLLAPGPARHALDRSDSNARLHYLLDDFTFSSAPSLAMLAAVAPPLSSAAAEDQGGKVDVLKGHDFSRAVSASGNNAALAAKGRILLLGNPISPSPDFPSLPMFSFEMSRIESHFPPAQMFVVAGPQATPAAYVASDPRRFSYIHFVSHAVANRISPLDSAIILSNPAGEEDSYKLYAREIIRHPIGARLVTISACYGSGTRAYAGEGLVGLSWAFLRAGAQRVIGALWEVSDESTPRLMDRLYQGLASGESPAGALRQAKLSLLHSQSKFRAPYYWAPFQLYGRE